MLVLRLSPITTTGLEVIDMINKAQPPIQHAHSIGNRTRLAAGVALLLTCYSGAGWAAFECGNTGGDLIFGQGSQGQQPGYARQFDDFHAQRSDAYLPKR